MKTLIGTSAVIAAVMFGAFAAIPSASAEDNEAFCLQRQSGQLECKYQSMEQCREAMKGLTPTGICSPNARPTGSGAGGMQQQPMAPMSPSR